MKRAMSSRRYLANASGVIAQGEVDQLMVARQIETSEEKYLQVITAKTAVLFAAACYGRG